jgi:hypothetical protein
MDYFLHKGRGKGRAPGGGVGAVDNWPAYARLLAGRYGGPLTHSSYTTTWGTTFVNIWNTISRTTSRSIARQTSAIDRALPTNKRDNVVCAF